MNKQVLKQIKNVRLGDLARVEWFDASVGKSLNSGAIDIPSRSWGIYLGVLGEKNKHIILAQRMVISVGLGTSISQSTNH